MKIDPIIAVKDVEKSAQWYKKVFSSKGLHRGDEFEILATQEDEIFLCLHKWGEHEHPSMKSPDINPGNGLILYFRTENMDEIRANLQIIEYPLAREIQLNPNSRYREFSVNDPDEYYLTISEFHKFEG